MIKLMLSSQAKDAEKCIGMHKDLRRGRGRDSHGRSDRGGDGPADREGSCMGGQAQKKDNGLQRDHIAVLLSSATTRIHFRMLFRLTQPKKIEEGGEFFSVKPC